MNLQQIKGTADDIGDGGEDITDESLTKYEKACADLGVSLKEVKDGVLQLRDPMVILEELANQVSKESENSVKVANLINAVGGKYRGNQLSALLQNWDSYKKMLAEYNSMEAQGSALRESEKSAQNLTGRLNALKNSVTELVNKFASADTLKNFVNILNSAVGGLNGMVDTFGTAGTIVPIFFAAFGAKNMGVLREVNSEATKISERFGVMHQSFTNIATDFKNGLGLRALTGVAKQSDIDNYNQYISAVKNGTVAETDFQTLLGKAPVRLQANAQEMATLITKNHNLAKSQAIINQAYKDGKVQETRYNNSMASINKQMTNNNARIQQLSSSTEMLTIKQRALNAAMSIGKTALSMLGNALIGLAISSVIGLFQKLINAQEEARQKAQEAAETLKEENNSIDEYIQKIIELRSTIDSNNVSTDEAKKAREELMQIQDEIISKYQLEADSINLVTGKLEEQTAALYNQQKQNFEEQYQLNKSGYDTARETINKQTVHLTSSLLEQINSPSQDLDEFYQYIENLLKEKGFTFAFKAKPELGTSDWSFAAFTADLYTIDELLKQIYEDIEKYPTKGSKEVKKAVDEALKYISNTRGNWSNKLIEENEEMFSQWVRYGSEYSDEYLNLVQLRTNYEYALNSKNAEKIEKTREEFLSRYNEIQTKLSNDTATENAGIAQFIADAFYDILNAENNIVDTQNNNTIPSVEDLTTAFEKLKDTVNDILGYANTYQSAMTKIAAGTALTADEIMKLLEIDPTLASKIKVTDGGWTIAIEDMMNGYKENVTKKIEDNIGTTKEELQENIKIYESTLSDLQAQQEAMGDHISSPSDYEKRSNIKNQIEQITESLKVANDQLSLFDFFESLGDWELPDVYIESYENMASKIKEYNSNISELNDAIDTMNEGSSLSYDEMTNLVNIYPELKQKITQTADGYSIETSALEDMREQAYETRNGYIDDSIEMTKTALEGVKTRIEAYEKEIKSLIILSGMPSSISDSIKENIINQYLKNNKDYQDLVAQAEGLEDLISKLEAYKNSVDTPNGSSNNNGNNVSDELQNQIDYYKSLIEAIGVVTDKRIEGLEAEKEALQEKNDEEQRELDLLEAKNNLEKAKKQKVFVYKKGEGLVQVQDTKAVAEAQKDYDDLLNEQEQDKLQKQIDSLTKYKEQFTNLETNIKDTLIVEQAKKVLNTNENGLLGLDSKSFDNIRNGLAQAIYSKDIYDNKDNTNYTSISYDDFLKSLGAKVTAAEFSSMANKAINNIPADISNDKRVINNASTITNNKSITLNNNFTINDANDPDKVVSQIQNYMNKVLTQTLNSII